MSAETVTDEHVRVAFTAVMDHQKAAREAVWSCPSTGQVRAMLEAVAPVLVAAERERLAELEAQLEHAKSAAAGSHEGIRLWMLDCDAVAAKHRERAEAVIAAVRVLCRSIPTPIAERILAVTGRQERSDEEETGHG